MVSQEMKIADLDDQQLAAVQSLESQFGTTIVALQPRHKIAKLSTEQLANLQVLENELGVVLLAFDSD